jgi:N-acetylglucosaminyl-diphospho-decaprenol L-rhamnosyltransferase
VTDVPQLKPATAIIVTYQSARTIGQTLDAARRCRQEGLLDVVIVDNASTDGTCEIIGREAPWAQLVLSGRNIGFGRGCNLGFKGVSSPYTIFLNPDAVVEPEAVRTMLQFMEENPRAGVVGPATICEASNGESGLQHTGQCPTPWTIVLNSIPLLKVRPIYWDIVPGSEPARTAWVCGAVLMIRTDLMRKLDGFDPRFFLYWEEMDLCKRAQAAGFEIWALGSAVAHHMLGASSSANDTLIGPCIARYFYQSRYYYMVKHHGNLAASAAEATEFVLLGLGSLVDVVRGRGLNRLRPRLEAPLFSQPERV